MVMDKDIIGGTSESSEGRPLIESKDSGENITLIGDVNDFKELSMKIKDFPDEKEKKKFIGKIKGLVRKSVEYSVWRDFIKYVLNQNYCALSKESIDEVSLSVHHHPISLETIVEAIVNKHIDEQKPFTSLEIAFLVLVEHFNDNVGYIVLLDSLHEKYHNGFLKIGIDDVHGKWKKFIEKYSQYIQDDKMETIKNNASIKESQNYFRVE